MTKVSELVNDLNNLKITANEFLDKHYPSDRKEQIAIRKGKLLLIQQTAHQFDEPFETEEDLVRNICEYCSDRNKTPEETILEVALYALAWDDLNKTICK